MGVLSDEDLVAMRTRARHRLIGALGLVLLLIVGVPLLIDRHDPPANALSDDVANGHTAAQDPPTPSPQPSSVSPLALPAGTPPAVGVPGNAAAGFDAAHAAASPPESARGGEPPSAPPASKPASETTVTAPAGKEAAAVSAPAASAPAAQTVTEGIAHPQAVPATIPPIDTQPPARHAAKAGEASAGADKSGSKPAKDEPAREQNRRESPAREERDKGGKTKEAASKSARDKGGKATDPVAKGDKPAVAPLKTASTDERAKDAKPSEAGGADSTAKPDKAAGAHGWLVQFGMFAVAENAEALTKRLEAKGIQAHHEPYASSRGNYTRVRAGPFPTRAAADEVLARARALGENASLVHQ